MIHKFGPRLLALAEWIFGFSSPCAIAFASFIGNGWEGDVAAELVQFVALIDGIGLLRGLPRAAGDGFNGQYLLTRSGPKPSAIVAVR